MDGHLLVSLNSLGYDIYGVFIDGTLCKTIIGAIDYAGLFSYAVFMIIR